MFQILTAPFLYWKSHPGFKFYWNEGVELSFFSTESSFDSLGSRFTGIRLLPLHRMVRCEYVICPCIIGISHLHNHFLCRLLTGHTNLKDFWGSDLSSISEVFLNGPVLWVSWLMVRAWDVTTSLRCHSDVYGWLRTARNWGPAIVLPDKQIY
jgi:hypothetical protein